MRTRARSPQRGRRVLATRLVLVALIAAAGAVSPAVSEAAPAGGVAATGDGADPVEAPTGAEAEDATEASDDVVISSWVIWVDRFDHVVVQHDLQVENRGERTWLGQAPDADGERAVVTVPVPAGGTGLETLGYFDECCATLRGGDFVHTTPLPPGEVTGTLRYHIERLDVLALRLDLPVETLTVLTPDGVSLDHDRFEITGETESQGRVYEAHTADDIDHGEVLELRFRGLTFDAPSPARFALAAGAALLVGGGGLAWARSRRARVVAAPAPGSGRTARERALTEADLLDEIALLDVGYERGFLDPAEYAGLRRARRRELLGPADGGEEAAVPASAAASELALLDVGLDRGLIAPATHERLRRARGAEAGALEATKG